MVINQSMWDSNMLRSTLDYETLETTLNLTKYIRLPWCCLQDCITMVISCINECNGSIKVLPYWSLNTKLNQGEKDMITSYYHGK